MLFVNRMRKFILYYCYCFFLILNYLNNFKNTFLNNYYEKKVVETSLKNFVYIYIMKFGEK